MGNGPLGGFKEVRAETEKKKQTNVSFKQDMSTGGYAKFSGEKDTRPCCDGNDRPSMFNPKG